MVVAVDPMIASVEVMAVVEPMLVSAFTYPFGT